MNAQPPKTSLCRLAREDACGFASVSDSRGIYFAPRVYTRRRAFTFTEVLFAVVILGIGFVMVAAILPVAIQQSSQGVDQSSSTAISAAALRQLAQVQTNQYCMYPPTVVLGQAPAAGRCFFFGDCTEVDTNGAPLKDAGGTNQVNPVATARSTGTAPAGFPYVVVSGTNYLLTNDYTTLTSPLPYDAQFGPIKGSLINSDDPRYGWIGFYQRGWSLVGATNVVNNYVNVTILTLRSRIHPTYTSSDLPYNFVPKRVYFSAKYYAPTQRTVVQFLTNSAGGTPYDDERSVEGAFLIVSDDSPTAVTSGLRNGRIFRLGNKLTDDTSGTVTGTASSVYWECQSGYELKSTEAAINPGVAFMVGRQLPNGAVPESASNIPTGPAQDIAVFQTIIPVQQQ